MKTKPIKLLEVNISKKLCDMGVGKGVLGYHKITTGKLGFLKSFKIWLIKIH